MSDAKSLCRMALLAPVLLVVSAGVIHAGTTPAGKCAIAKNKAAVKKVAAKAKCWQKAFASGAPTADSTCLNDAEMKFSTAIAKAEAKGGCLVTGDASLIEGTADACVNRIVGETPAGCPSLVCNGQCLCGCVSGTDCSNCIQFSGGQAFVCPSGATCETVLDGLVFSGSACVAPPAQCAAADINNAVVFCGASNPVGCCICGTTVEGQACFIPPSTESQCAGSTACPASDQCTASSQCSPGFVCVTGQCAFKVCSRACS